MRKRNELLRLRKKKTDFCVRFNRDDDDEKILHLCTEISETATRRKIFSTGNQSSVQSKYGRNEWNGKQLKRRKTNSIRDFFLRW
ncbi:CLUMA_CG000525, isoform A [Clunio marinus]|uniref:CLUMA_CG000525, isoform A n=1 Tax=Clunio marinus TaxID=568069 RepID=A0A1J1HH02_9DIPT|nr:CLUMA_CG000525, isoform A [Clunio marinus]